MADVRNISFAPTLSNFIRSDAHHAFIVGPLGSGKTIAMIHKLLLIAANQAPAPDGIRYTRFAIVRMTLAQARQTILRDVLEYFKGIVAYKVSDFTISIRSGDIHSDWILYPLSDLEDQRRLLSSQLTGSALNEFTQIDPDLIAPIFGRCGRYPSKAQGGATWHGIIGDSNPGATGSPWHKLLVEELPKGWEYLEQPTPFLDFEQGVVDPAAENLENLPPQYYENLWDSSDRTWARRYLAGRWVLSMSGQAVFNSSFELDWHVSDAELVPVPDRPIVIGLDVERHPACVFIQEDATGRVQVLAEAWALNVGITKFIREYIRPLAHQPRFSRCRILVSADPAANRHSPIGERTVLDAVRAEGLDAFAAPTTNRIEPRLAIIENRLLEQRAGKPAIVFDGVNCGFLVRAMAADYQYRLKKDKSYEDTPVKSHPAADLVDSLGYSLFGLSKYGLGRYMRRLNATPEAPLPASAWT